MSHALTDKVLAETLSVEVELMHQLSTAIVGK
jgi:hypothetical protein